MTRDQIKQKIIDIIAEVVYNDWYGELHQVDLAAENIMKLWDQGFVYEVKKDGCYLGDL